MTPRHLRISALIAIIVAITAAGLVSSRQDIASRVRYQLTSDGIGAPDHTSPASPSAPPLDGVPVRVAVAGDVGTGEDAARRTAVAMDNLEGKSEYAALLLLGDNVYPNGDPAELGRTVFEPFADVLDGGTQLLPVLGNHDVRDDHGDAQAEAIGMPARWYATRIDDVLIVCLDSNRPDDAEQLAWLDSTLQSTDATWIIAMMHHPPYSGGSHGSSLDVRANFSPLFERYGVQLVLAGHDHDYQRSRSINGVTYVVSGGAAKLRPANLADFTEVAWSTYHFVDVAIWPDRLELRAVDQSGAVIDSVTLAP